MVSHYRRPVSGIVSNDNLLDMKQLNDGSLMIAYKFGIDTVVDTYIFTMVDNAPHLEPDLEQAIIGEGELYGVAMIETIENDGSLIAVGYGHQVGTCGVKFFNYDNISGVTNVKPSIVIFFYVVCTCMFWLTLL